MLRRPRWGRNKSRRRRRAERPRRMAQTKRMARNTSQTIPNISLTAQATSGMFKPTCGSPRWRRKAKRLYKGRGYGTASKLTSASLRPEFPWSQSTFQLSRGKTAKKPSFRHCMKKAPRQKKRKKRKMSPRPLERTISARHYPAGKGLLPHGLWSPQKEKLRCRNHLWINNVRSWVWSANSLSCRSPIVTIQMRTKKKRKRLCLLINLLS